LECIASRCAILAERSQFVAARLCNHPARVEEARLILAEQSQFYRPRHGARDIFGRTKPILSERA
jgi:hypothetical protein